MKKMLFACAALVMAFTTLTALAATDVTGTWGAEVKGPGGSTGYHLSFTFKQDGDKLTGTVGGPQGDPITITDGKVDGAKISFKVAFNGTTITHEGTINTAGDEIKMTSKSDQGDFPGADMTLKRLEAGKAPPAN